MGVQVSWHSFNIACFHWPIKLSLLLISWAASIVLLTAKVESFVNFYGRIDLKCILRGDAVVCLSLKSCNVWWEWVSVVSIRILFSNLPRLDSNSYRNYFVWEFILMLWRCIPLLKRLRLVYFLSSHIHRTLLLNLSVIWLFVFRFYDALRCRHHISRGISIRVSSFHDNYRVIIEFHFSRCGT